MSELPQPPHPNSGKPEWASWLADVGRITKAFKIFPCRPDDGSVDEAGKPNCKKPRFAGWQGSASWDRKSVAATWTDFADSNIGLAIQPGAVALDADLYKPGNEALLRDFEAEYGELPRTLEFCSANGGFHLIYITNRLLGNGMGTLPKFGDVRGHGGYLVGPGSTVEGKPYTAAEITLPVALPAHVDARLIEKRSTAAADRTPPQGVILDDPLNIARYTTWLLTEAKLGTSGVDGNHTLAATAAMGASYALTETETVHLMVEHWNARQAEPWTPEQIEKHGGSGYRSSTSAFGNMAKPNPLALGFKAVEGGSDVVLERDVWRSMSDIAGPAPARQWAAGDDSDGWVPLGGITFLYGAGGVGKTALVGQWALSQARGEPLFGTIPLRKMPIVLIAAEDDESELHRRFEKQGRRLDDDVTFAAIRGRDTALHPPFRQAGAEDTWLFNLISHKLASMPAGPKMLILDNLGQLYLGNYFEPSEIIRFLNGYLGRLAEQHEATIIVLAHPSESQKTTGDGGYGGVAWSAGVRSRLYFERHMIRGSKAGDKPRMVGRERVLSRKKANYADDTGAGLVLDWDDWKFVPVAKPDSAASLFKPVQETDAGGQMRGGRAAMVAHERIQRAVEDELASNKLKLFSGAELATGAAHRLAKEQAGEGVTINAIRTTNLKRMIEAGHPAFQGRGWRHPTSH